MPREALRTRASFPSAILQPRSQAATAVTMTDATDAITAAVPSTRAAAQAAAITTAAVLSIQAAATTTAAALSIQAAATTTAAALSTQAAATTTAAALSTRAAATTTAAVLSTRAAATTTTLPQSVRDPLLRRERISPWMSSAHSSLLSPSPEIPSLRLSRRLRMSPLLPQLHPQAAMITSLSSLSRSPMLPLRSRQLFPRMTSSLSSPSPLPLRHSPSPLYSSLRLSSPLPP